MCIDMKNELDALPENDLARTEKKTKATKPAKPAAKKAEPVINRELVMHKDIAQQVKAGKALLGSKTVIRGVKETTVSTVYAASNCPAGLKQQLTYYAGRFGTTVHYLEADSAALGEVCGKPFTALVVGVKK